MSHPALRLKERTGSLQPEGADGVSAYRRSGQHCVSTRSTRSKLRLKERAGSPQPSARSFSSEAEKQSMDRGSVSWTEVQADLLNPEHECKGERSKGGPVWQSSRTAPLRWPQILEKRPAGSCAAPEGSQTHCLSIPAPRSPVPTPGNHISLTAAWRSTPLVFTLKWLRM